MLEKFAQELAFYEYMRCAICHGESVEIHIGEYQAVKFFG